VLPARASWRRAAIASLLARSADIDVLARELGGGATRGSVDVADDLERFVRESLEAHGRIDAVVNNTGHPPKGPLLELTDLDWHAGMDMVFMNVVRMARLVTPTMRAQGSGAIVNISTFSAYEPDARYPVSSCLRSALGSFTKLYADAHASLGIRMNNVLPGFIDTSGANDAIREKIPARRYGDVAEIAKTVAFLLSPTRAISRPEPSRDGGLRARYDRHAHHRRCLLVLRCFRVGDGGIVR
jgi:NAD(P)-dependent dehydrogenase (short-subunit alcohol dehydrogenase family)